MAEAGALDAMQLASLHSFNELVAPRVCKAKAELVEAERG